MNQSIRHPFEEKLCEISIDLFLGRITTHAIAGHFEEVVENIWLKPPPFPHPL